MGLGDNLLASGMAIGAKARGKRIAFGNGDRIIWDQHSETIFAGNPNIARPGSEGSPDLDWVAFFKGHRLYNRQDGPHRWIWNMAFRPIPGEIYLDKMETKAGARLGNGFVVIEPNVPAWKSSAVNKEWGRAKYQQLADRLIENGLRLVQFQFPKGGAALNGVEQVKTQSFRDALALLSHAALYVGPEGGMHHGAAAVKIGAVVLFGGFIPPQVTGYDTHANLTGGAEACGSLYPCQHCRDAMDAITVDQVHEEVMERI